MKSSDMWYSGIGTLELPLTLNRSKDMIASPVLSRHSQASQKVFCEPQKHLKTEEQQIKMNPQYKLTYFNFKGLAEPIRQLFYYSGVEFEDVRIESADWEKLKPNMPWNCVPVLEEVNGTQLSQSTTILRYLGRKFKLAGADDFETAKCDEYVDAVNDVRLECKACFNEEDETKKAAIKGKLQSESLPRILKKFEEILEKNENGVLVGCSVTYSDIYVAHFLSTICEWLEVKLDSFQGVSAHCTKIFNLPGIKEWIAKRPVTLF